MYKSTSLTLLGILMLAGSTIAKPFVLPEGTSETDRKRFERFENFEIKGVCGDSDIDRLSTLGVNTVRGYTIGEPKEMVKKLDHAQSLGMKMIVSEWMPHQGENKNKEGLIWNFDYAAKGDQMIKNLVEKVEAIGDHPAILMWGLGNEVHLDEPYLHVVNRMSEEIHKRFPHHLTSLTMINAKPEQIAKIKKFAPDIDVLGIQSYSRGAVHGSIKYAEEHWAKPFYVSEFNANGPWNYGKTPWGVALDEPVTRKVSDLKACYASIAESPLCVGGTVFVWNHYAVDDRPTYFSLLLDANPAGPKNGSFDDLMMPPQADVMVEHFTGQPIKGNRAPAISKLEFEGGARSLLTKPGEPMNIRFAAEDSNGDVVNFVTWILKAKVKKTTPVAGPIPQASLDHVIVKAPTTPGEYLVMVYAKDEKGGASATVLPFKVEEPVAETAATPAAAPQP